MNDNEINKIKERRENAEKEISRRLAEDIRVVEAIKNIVKSKHWIQFVESFISPNITRLYQEIQNAARNTNHEAYLSKFYSAQGEIKILEKLEDLESFAGRYDDEIKGLRKQLEQLHHA